MFSPKVLIYLYFEAQETEIKNRITDIENRILKSNNEVSERDLIELLKLQVRFNTYLKIDKELTDMFDNY